MTSRVTPKECSLRVAVGEHERCPGARCAFWEDGAGTVAGGCTIERLHVPLETPALARHLLDVRLRLEGLCADAEREDARRRFAELLNLNRD
jgi:hypothetical protein